MYDKQWTRRKANQAPGQNFPRMGIWWESGLGLKTSSKVVTAGHQPVVPESLKAFSMEFGNNKDKLALTELTVKDANGDSGSGEHIKHKLLTDGTINKTNWDSCKNFTIKVDKASMAQMQCKVKHNASKGSKQVADVADVATSIELEAISAGGSKMQAGSLVLRISEEVTEATWYECDLPTATDQ